MMYSTRRKSVNLASLGIHVPRPVVHRSPPTSIDGSEHSPTHSSKRVKRSHSDLSSRHGHHDQTPKFVFPRPQDVRPSSFAAHTPPPSPPPSGGELDTIAPPKKVDTDGINDDVVVATIEQLEKENNRPHLLKELAIAIAGHVAVVETSANQSAIISSRLTNFLKRPWTALAPCPLGKELVGTHPKRLYFFLSGQPRQAIPDPDAPQNKVSRIISPSLTSATDEEEHVTRSRAEMSPSPELELWSPELDEDEEQLSRSASYGGSIAPSSFSQSRASPPMERDEHEFTQTAESLQQRKKNAAQATMDRIRLDHALAFEPSHLYEELEGLAAQRKRDYSTADLEDRKGAFGLSSPILIPQIDAKLDSASLVLSIADSIEHNSWCSLKSAETLELDELETLFESY